ncbi:MAG: glycine betaine ABC transporter substrate-binding protein [bacterium]|jgi:glycine betaine/proline transport system substrate-binding protein
MLFRKARVLAVVLVMVLCAAAAVGCTTTGGEGAEPAPGASLAYVDWASESASTHVVKAVLEQELGYEVELSVLDAGPMFTGVAKGSYDGIVAAWLPETHADYMAEFGDQFVDLGPNLEGAKIGWVVPAYVEIDSIEEMNEVADKLGNRIVGIDPGSGLMRASDKAMAEYGLEENFELLDGSDASMAAALKRAIDNEEWIVVTGWTPHWKFARWDLKYLDDPRGGFGEAENIHTIVREGLEEDDPVLYEFLDNFSWTPEDMSEVMVMVEDGMTPEEAASRWVNDNRDKVAEWLPATE